VEGASANAEVSSQGEDAGDENQREGGFADQRVGGIDLAHGAGPGRTWIRIRIRNRDMRVRCDRNELAESVGNVLGIVPPAQPTKPIFSCFHLKTDGGSLIVQASDLDMGARIRLERVEVLEAGEAAVPAARFSSLVREIPDKQVLLEGLPEGRGIEVKAQSCEFKLLGEDHQDFPQVTDFHADSALKVSREKFLEALRRVAVAASRDTARFQLTGVFFEAEDDKLIMTATDGKRLTNDHIRIENTKKAKSNAIVPNRAVDVLLKVLAQGEPTISLVIKDPDLQVSFGHGQLTAKVIQGTYPEYRVALSQKVVTKVTAKRNDLLSAVKTAALMTDRQTATVIFNFAADKVSLSTHASDIGESRIEVPISLDGDPMEVRFNPAYFNDALRCLMDDEVRIELTDREKPAAVRGGHHYRHLVMPLVTN
jgi:DNA polymerase-3 subunit beta